MTADDAQTRVEHAAADLLLAALDDQPARHARGGTCPECGEPAWAPDTATWTCARGHRGTVWRLRRAVLEDDRAIQRLCGEPVRGAQWPEDLASCGPPPDPFFGPNAA